MYIFDNLVVSDGENSVRVAMHPRRVGGDIWYQEDKEAKEGVCEALREQKKWAITSGEEGTEVPRPCWRGTPLPIVEAEKKVCLRLARSV